jgi:hypothetical protein
MRILLTLLLLAAQESPEAALAKKCDSQIPWITDGVELIDMELAAGHHPQYPEAREPKNYKVDRGALLAKAQAKAVEEKRLILWYCPRVYGLHMYRAYLTDRYMKATAFTDPGVVDLIRAKFVPLRMCCDAETGKATGLKPFDFVEPGFVILTPEGKIVHVIDKIRTFNADWFRAALIAVLKKTPEYNRPAGESIDDLIKGGDHEKAMTKATVDQQALVLRRAGVFERVLLLECSALHKGIALLGLRRFDEARKVLEKETSPEAIYHLAAVDLWTGKDPAPRLRSLVEKHPDSPWAWRAAANLVKSDDSLPEGPLVHHFESFFFRGFSQTPTSTRSPVSVPDIVTDRALEFLLAAQWEDGGWRDARYAYWPTPKILPNVWTAITALSALALMEWRDLAPGRVDAALKRADAALRDEGRLAPDQHEETYAEAYRLHYFAARKDTSMMNRIVARLRRIQDADGFWCHEYANPFSTAAVVHALAVARKAGADVPDILFQRAAVALTSTRGEGGRQVYRTGEKVDNEKSSMARTPLCELALYECGRGSLENVAAGVELYWKMVDRLEAVRQCDYHSDGRLAGFFYFHAGFHTLEAARTLDASAREKTFKRFRERLLAIPEWDGSFVDSHELGKSYATASALLMLGRSRP